MNERIDEHRLENLPANQRLWAALQVNDIGEVEASLKAGAHPDACSPAGRTSPLYFTLAKGYTLCSLALVEAGATPSYNPLSENAWVGCIEYNNPLVFNALKKRHAMSAAESYQCLKACLGVGPSATRLLFSSRWVDHVLRAEGGKQPWSEGQLGQWLADIVYRRKDGNEHELVACLEKLVRAGVLSPDMDASSVDNAWSYVAVNLEEKALLADPVIIQALANAVPLGPFQFYKGQPSRVSEMFTVVASTIEHAQLEAMVPKVSSKKAPGRL